MIKIIAEIGVNHNGSIDKAYELTDQAIDAGADIIKFQLWSYKTFPEYEDWRISYSEMKSLKEDIEGYGKEFLCTPDDEESLQFLIDIGCEKIKIGSAKAEDLDFIKKIPKNIELIISSGMIPEQKVDFATKIRKELQNKTSILYCISKYPTPYEDFSHALLSFFNGLSDHTIGDEIILSSIPFLIGDCYIEKHFTFDKKAEGPDHICSLEPQEFKEMVRKIRNIERAL